MLTFPSTITQILVNNAGISSHGESLNLSLDEVLRMIQVNTMSVTTLTHLFGRDMKERRRGRILMVSSICGAVSGIATVAVYSATKAFENSFGISIGKELEPYGVGVTCLLPGAVRGTEFKSRSNSQEALCWKLPFYTKTAPSVAELGVRALLRGDTEVTPGVLNRMFLKVFKPVMPPRLHNLVAEIMWNPLQLPFRRTTEDQQFTVETGQEPGNETNTVAGLAPPTSSLKLPIIVRPRPYSYNTPPPRLLILEEIAPVKEPPTTPDDSEVQPDDSEVQTGEASPAASTDKVETVDGPAPIDKVAVSPGEKVVDNISDRVKADPPKPEKRPIERESLSEIELLLEQYNRNRAFSLDDEKYFRDPLSSRLDAYMLGN